MNIKLLMPLLLLVSFLPAANAVAQQQRSLQEQRTQQQQAAQSGPLHWAQKTSDILDKKIMSNDGKELGTAKDLVIGRDGKIEYVILSVGGFLGIGSDRVVVPWDKIRSTPNVDLLVADVSQSEVQWQPEEAERGDTELATRSDRELDTRSDRERATGSSAPAMSLAQVEPKRVKELMGETVVGIDGEELGRLADLFPAHDGRPLYAVVQDDSNKLHPLPAQLVRTNPGGKPGLSADVDRQAFLDSPSYDRSQIAGFQWEPEVRGYYQDRFQEGQSGQQPVR